MKTNGTVEPNCWSLLDPSHATFDIFDDPFVKEIWTKRYKAEGEESIRDTFDRVANAVAQAESNKERAGWSARFFNAMVTGCFMPAGRILSSAGLTTKSTLQNCYVSCSIEDSMEGIHKAYAEAMTTLGRFGGIGMDFTPIRPKGAKVGTQGLVSPGVVKWMEMWHEGADRIMQAGHRRGAMMGTLADHHPDILDFIEAKHTKGALTNFNVSVLISDAFMKAVEDDAMWDLYHERPWVTSGSHNFAKEVNGKQVCVYKTLPARELWDKILQSTYKYSEPGVIFIDKINKMNNLWYCENIRCTNPCGEQPLPPHGACNLGHINLARMVHKPFTEDAKINFEMIEHITQIAVRFLDNVIDVSEFPLPMQRYEQQQKRRIGLGISGLHDMLIQLGLKYDSVEAIQAAEQAMMCIATEAYEASMDLGAERGSFPALDRKKYSSKGFAKAMHFLHSGRGNYEMRNSLLLTVAPTGTVSIVYGNISSGIEPNFAFKQSRKVWVANNQQETHTNEVFISRFFNYCKGEDADINGWRAAQTQKDISVEAHINMQAAIQFWVDASVTKTVNCPPGMAYEDFKNVYTMAYSKGCKGCTTYVPSDIRGNVISSADATSKKEPSAILEGMDFGEVGKLESVDYSKAEERIIASILAPKLKVPPAKRPGVLVGCTYKVKWPSLNDNVYLTINELDGRPWEVFIASMDLRQIEWMVLNCIMLSRCLRNGENPMELARMFQKIQGAHDGQWVGGKYYTSLVSYIGKMLEDHFQKYEPSTEGAITGRMAHSQHVSEELPAGHKMSGHGAPSGGIQSDDQVVGQFTGKTCPRCISPTLFPHGDCWECTNCGYMKCG